MLKVTVYNHGKQMAVLADGSAIEPHSWRSVYHDEHVQTLVESGRLTKVADVVYDQMHEAARAAIQDTIDHNRHDVPMADDPQVVAAMEDTTAPPRESGGDTSESTADATSKATDTAQKTRSK